MCGTCKTLMINCRSYYVPWHDKTITINFYLQVSVVDELGIPVKFVGVGEKVDDLQPFDAEEFVNAIFAWGVSRYSGDQITACPWILLDLFNSISQTWFLGRSLCLRCCYVNPQALLQSACWGLEWLMLLCLHDSRRKQKAIQCKSIPANSLENCSPWLMIERKKTVICSSYVISFISLLFSLLKARK